MNIFLSVLVFGLLISHCEVYFNSGNLPERIKDSLSVILSAHQFCEDSSFIQQVVKKLFDYYESAGIIDPHITVIKEDSNGTIKYKFEISNERVTYISGVRLKKGDVVNENKFLKRVFLKGGIFVKEDYEKKASFLRTYSLFPFERYYFQKSGDKYYLILEYNNFSTFPVFFINYDGDGLSSFFAYEGSSYYSFPFNVQLKLSFKYRQIQGFHMGIKFPISFERRFLLKFEFLKDSVLLEKIAFEKHYGEIQISTNFVLNSCHFKSIGLSGLFNNTSVICGSNVEYGRNFFRFFFFTSAKFPYLVSPGLSVVYSSGTLKIPLLSGLNVVESNEIFSECYVEYKSFVISRTFQQPGRTAVGVLKKISNKTVYLGVSKRDDISSPEGLTLILFSFSNAPPLDFLNFLN
ncbi:MAG: hypothetical protein ACPLN0_00575 [Candidatus Hydrothermia bacterium]